MSEPSDTPRPSMGRVVITTITSMTGVAIVLFAGALLYTFHHQLHAQVGQMLLQMVRTEADGVINEVEHGVHVHDTSVMLPTLRGERVEKYSLAFDADCEVLASTSNVTTERVPTQWCDRRLELGDHRLFHTDNLAEPKLRAAWFVARHPDGSPLVFVTGVPDEVVHGSFYRTAAVLAVLLAMLFGVISLAAWLVSRRLSADLGKLSETCEQITERAAELDGAELHRRLTISETAPAELAALAATVRDLVTRLNRMVQVQNRFIAEAAHELRTPLTALQGELELTLRRERSGDEYCEALERALGDARRLSGLYDRLLSAARTQSEQIVAARVSLSEVVNESLSRFGGRIADAGIAVDLRLEDLDDPYCVRGDKLACARLLDNLLSNVVEHSQAAKLRLSLERDVQPLGTSGLTEQVVLRVEDDGDGIDVDEIDELFVPFTAHSRKGHGLGLYIAERLMRKQGGALELQPCDIGTRWALRFRAA